MDIRAAIADERRRIAGLVDSLQPGQLDTPSLCGDWTVKEVAGHLVAASGAAPGSSLLGMLVRSGFNLHKANSRLAVRAADRPAAELARMLRDSADSPFVAPLVGSAGQLTDLQVHGQDMRRPLGLPHGLQLDRLKVSLEFLTGGKAFGFTPRRRLAGLRFEAADLNWFSGVGELVAGPAETLVMAMCGRDAVLSELDGPGVRILRGRILGRRAA